MSTKMSLRTESERGMGGQAVVDLVELVRSGLAEQGQDVPEKL